MVQIDLSFIIPVYNVEKYLNECLSSIYSVQYISYEVIIVNDGSTDNSYDIIQYYMSLYPQKTIIVNKINGGLSSARNTGLNKAQGNYIAFIDSDDFINSNRIVEILYKAKEFQLDIAFGDYSFCDENSKILLTPKRYLIERMKAYQVYNGLNYWEAALNRNQISVEACFQLYNSNFLRKNNLNFKEGIYHEDFLFSYKCILYAKKVMYVPLSFYCYRQRSGSIMSSSELKSLKQLHKLEIIKELLDLKIHYDLSLYSWDTILFINYFDVVRNGKIKNKKLYISLLSNCKMFTIKMMIGKILLPFLNLFAKDISK